MGSVAKKKDKAIAKYPAEIPAAMLPLWEDYWRKRTDEGRNALVVAYQGLAVVMVRRFGMRLPRSVDRGDLLTAANVGLMSAIESFDPERGVRFESYGGMRIRGALLDELRSEDWLPRPWRQRMEHRKRTIERLRSEQGREPRDQDVAEAMELTLSEYEFLFGTGLPGAPSGSMPSGEGGEEGVVSGLEVIADIRSDPPGERLMRDELFRLAVERLTEQERQIAWLKYHEELPMREIGQLMSLSESRVCKIHARLLERLKDRFRVGVDEE